MDDAHAPPASLPGAAIAALQRGNKIAAIKIVREERGLGLKEAKDEVEAFVRSQPSLRSSLAAGQAVAKRSALRWFVIAVVVVALAYYFLSRR